MRELYLDSDSVGSEDMRALNRQLKAQRMADLRELELRFLALPTTDGASSLSAKRRRQELARMEFSGKLAAARGWLDSDSVCPQAAWRSIVTDLRQLLEEAEGYTVGERSETTIVEGSN